MRALLVAALLIAAPASAAGIVVVPFATSDDELAIFGKRTAEAVAQALGGGARVAAARDRGKASLLLELRASRTGGKVRLEGVLRRQTGTTLARVAAGPVALADLDRAAADLARRARRAVDREQTRRVAPTTPEAPTRTDPLAGLVDVDDEEVVVASARPVAPSDTRPVLMVTVPDGELGADPPLVRTLGTAALVVLARDLGFRGVPGTYAGILKPSFAAGEARRTGARGALMLRIIGLDFRWRGGRDPLLVAKGRVRVSLVDGAGSVRLDRTVTTDTLVGGRGDAEGALTRYVLRQAAEIVRPELRRALATRPL